MICVVPGEYTTPPVLAGISDSPRCLPARLISTPTCPASMRVTRTSNENKMITPSSTATPITIAHNPGILGLMTNGGRSPPSRGPRLIAPMYLSSIRKLLPGARRKDCFYHCQYEYLHTKLTQ